MKNLSIAGLNSIMDYFAHWVIGIFAALVWASGKNWNLDPSFISFASWTLPIVVGHALSISQRKYDDSNAGTQPVPNIPPENPASTS